MVCPHRGNPVEEVRRLNRLSNGAPGDNTELAKTTATRVPRIPEYRAFWRRFGGYTPRKFSSRFNLRGSSSRSTAFQTSRMQTPETVFAKPALETAHARCVRRFK